MEIATSIFTLSTAITFPPPWSSKKRGTDWMESEEIFLNSSPFSIWFSFGFFFQARTICCRGDKMMNAWFWAQLKQTTFSKSTCFVSKWRLWKAPCPYYVTSLQVSSVTDSQDQGKKKKKMEISLNPHLATALCALNTEFRFLLHFSSSLRTNQGSHKLKRCWEFCLLRINKTEITSHKINPKRNISQFP